MSFHEYQRGEGLSLIAVVFFASVSLAAIAYVLLRHSSASLVSLFRSARKRDAHHSRVFFNTQLGAYVASLLLSNVLSSIAAIINAGWIGHKGVTEGALCSAQGILILIGDSGGSYFTGAIVIHTFNTLVLRNRLPHWIRVTAIIGGWLIAVLIGAVPTFISNGTLGPIYGFNGMSCGISQRWSGLHTTLHLVPISLASLISVVFNILIFLVLRGTLSFKDGLNFKLNARARWSVASNTTLEYKRFIAAVTRSMLWYPFAFNVLLLPQTVASLMPSAGLGVPFKFQVFATAFASMIGLANALILCNTLRILAPFMNETPARLREADMESFFALSKSPVSVGDASPQTPNSIEKAFAYPASDSKSERAPWVPPPRSVSRLQPSSIVSETVSQNLSRVSRAMSFKRKSQSTAPVPSVTITRPIATVADINAQIAVPEPVYKQDKRLPALSIGLPVPRRTTRSPVVRQPSNPPEDSPVLDAMLTTVNLMTPPPDMTTIARDNQSTRSSTGSRDSFIIMYLARSPARETNSPEDAVTLPVPPKTKDDLSMAKLIAVADPAVIPPPKSSAITGKGAEQKELLELPRSLAMANMLVGSVSRRRTAASTKTARRRSKSLDEKLNVPSALNLSPRTPSSSMASASARMPSSTMPSALMPMALARPPPSAMPLSSARYPISARPPLGSARPPVSARPLASVRTPNGFNGSLGLPTPVRQASLSAVGTPPSSAAALRGLRGTEPKTPRPYGYI
ncbi:hypothetical protein A0H81_07543 [Grifola frondosa]|uniref:G-protein coupled receptors family 1 profile domain-containing protein n=1 Tax=Grifola frondosa TaxID=5627 RepID=A0A1C7M6M2_GRIFR|nr:hypothetical protein A0H81_07543 [Grifola frondosa]